jgi:hypothetical protein
LRPSTYLSRRDGEAKLSALSHAGLGRVVALPDDLVGEDTLTDSLDQTATILVFARQVGLLGNRDRHDRDVAGGGPNREEVRATTGLSCVARASHGALAIGNLFGTINERVAAD